MFNNLVDSLNLSYVYAVIIVLAIGIVLGILLALANKYLKVEEDPHKEDILKMLPGANCGACGFPGCSGLADAMAKKECSKAEACKVIRGEAKDKLQSYLDEM